MRILMVFIMFGLSMGCTSDDAKTASFDAETAIDAGEQGDMGLAEVGVSQDSGSPQAMNIGYREGVVAYTPEGSSGVRELPLSIWYPTTESEGRTALYYNLFERMDVFENATVALEGPAPVLLFSHGRKGFGQYSFFLTEHFARNGWVVAAVDHVGDRFNQEDTPDDIYSLRPQDISALIDHLNALDGSDPLSGLISDKIAVSGHSFGGFTALALSGAVFDIEVLRTDCMGEWGADSFCRNLALDDALFAMGFQDPRIKAALPIAPGNTRLFGSGDGREGIGISQIEIPTLLITGARDRSLADDRHGTPIWAALRGTGHRRLQFLEGGHFTFTSICSISGALGVGNGCDESFIPIEQAHSIVNRYALAFLRRHFFADESEAAILDGEEPLPEGILVERKESDDE